MATSGWKMVASWFASKRNEKAAAAPLLSFLKTTEVHRRERRSKRKRKRERGGMGGGEMTEPGEDLLTRIDSRRVLPKKIKKVAVKS